MTTTATFTWSITGLETQNLDNLTDAVVVAGWQLTATDGTNTVDRAGRQRLTPNPQEFTAYSNLTQAQVLTWVQQDLGSARVEMYQRMLSDRLAAIANPPARPTPKTLPW